MIKRRNAASQRPSDAATVAPERDFVRTLRSYDPKPSEGPLEIKRSVGPDEPGRPPLAMLNSVRYLINTRGLAGEAELPQRLGVTSAIDGEGTTSVARALAAVLADDFDAWVCLVDLSWAREAPYEAGNDTGLFDLFTSAVELDDVLALDDDAGFVVLRPGSVPQRGSHALTRSPGLESVVSALCAEFDYVVFDLPPALASNAGLPVFKFVEAYVLVTLAGVTRADQVERTVEQLREIPLLGTVLNRQTTRVPRVLRRVLSA